MATRPHERDGPNLIFDTGASQTYLGGRHNIKLSNMHRVSGKTAITASDEVIKVNVRGQWGKIPNCYILPGSTQSLVSPQHIAHYFPGCAFVILDDQIYLVPSDEIGDICTGYPIIANLDRTRGTFTVDAQALFDALDPYDEAAQRGGGYDEDDHDHRDCEHGRGAGDRVSDARGAGDRVSDAPHYLNVLKQQELVRRVHERFGHISLPQLREALKAGTKTGTGLTLAAVNEAINNHFQCTWCDLAKITRAPEPRASKHVKTEDVLGVVHLDLMVRPDGMKSRRGFKYTLVYIDEATHLYGAIHMKRKNDVYSALNTMESTLAVKAKDSVAAEYRSNIRIRKYRTDGDGMFNSHRIRAHMAEKLIRHDQSIPHQHNNNAFIERGIRRVEDVARAMMIQSGFPPSFWCYAVDYAILILNVSPSRSPQYVVSPHQLWYGQPPSIERFRRFGCHCIAWRPVDKRENRDKIADPAGKNMRFVGFPKNNIRAYLTYDPITLEVKTSSSVRFREDLTTPSTKYNISKIVQQPEHPHYKRALRHVQDMFSFFGGHPFDPQDPPWAEEPRIASNTDEDSARPTETGFPAPRGPRRPEHLRRRPDRDGRVPTAARARPRRARARGEERKRPRQAGGHERRMGPGLPGHPALTLVQADRGRRGLRPDRARSEEHPRGSRGATQHLLQARPRHNSMGA